MGRRSAKARFAPGILVFPGGRLDPSDRSATVLTAAPATLDAASRRLYGALWLTAQRELTEETGYVLREGSQPQLIVRAITPASSPIRFHTRFFLADGKAAVKAKEGDGELQEIAWYPTEKALSFDLWDVTEFVLHEACRRFGRPPEPALLFSYRGESARRAHQPKS